MEDRKASATQLDPTDTLLYLSSRLREMRDGKKASKASRASWKDGVIHRMGPSNGQNPPSSEPEPTCSRAGKANNVSPKEVVVNIICSYEHNVVKTTNIIANPTTVMIKFVRTSITKLAVL